jgi:hypothetical protein
MRAADLRTRDLRIPENPPSFKKILERRGHSAGNLKIEISCRMTSSFEYLFKWWWVYVEISGMKDSRSKFIKGVAQVLRKHEIQENSKGVI